MLDFMSIIPISIMVLLFLIFVFSFYYHYIGFIQEQINIDTAISCTNKFIAENSIYSNLEIPNEYKTSFGIQVNNKLFGNKSNISIVFPIVYNGKITKVVGYA